MRHKATRSAAANDSPKRERIQIARAKIAVATVALCLMGCTDADMPTQPRESRPPRSVLVNVDGTGDYATIQAAIDASQDGDTVLLSNGRFRGDGNRDLMFKGRRIVLRSCSRDPVYCLLDCDGTPTEPHRGLTFSSGEDSACVVEGITIEDGYAVGGGGAVRCEAGSSPVFLNMIFRTHRVVAVRCDGASPTLLGCEFRSNFNGAIFCHGGAPVVTSCTFIDNYADYAGGAIAVSSSSITIVECEFVRNAAGFSGGAVDANNLSLDAGSRVLVTNSHFYDNVSGYYGGGAYLDNVAFEFIGSEFVSNIAGAGGGAVWCAAQIVGTFERCLFYDNEAGKGAAVANSGSPAVIARSVLAQNHGGDVVSCDSLTGVGTTTMTCSDVNDNDAGDWVGCIAGQDGVYGNISADPLFCDAQVRDFRLRPNSPCAADSVCGVIGASPVGCQETGQLARPMKRSRSKAGMLPSGQNGK